ncbi:MAG: hypothetical protein HY329_27205 [Chloroflexi bacterium]|nr:hypothetical protein [Chloroflexota bacterium]
MREYRAGELAPPGRYVRIDHECRRIVTLSERGQLPGSLDGRAALYRALLFDPGARCQSAKSRHRRPSRPNDLSGASSR